MMKPDDSVSMEKEHKEDDAPNVAGVAGSRGGRPSIPSNWKTKGASSNHSKRLDLIHLLIGNCTGMCAAFPSRAANAARRGGAECPSRSDFQFVELQGLRFIGLGALADELTPRERVYDTLEQLRTRTERLISIGYFIDKPVEDGEGSIVKTTFTVPLDVWSQTNDGSDRSSVSNQVQTIVDLTTTKRFQPLKDTLTAQLRSQKKHPNSGHNKYLAGITAHNLGVLAVMTGKPDDAVAYFREAICLKEAAFGRNDAEVALSWDELGIQCFARGDFDGALTSFREAHTVRNGIFKEQQMMMQSQSSHTSRGSSSSPTPPASPAQHPSVAMVLNNMACCYFQMGNARQALLTLEEADEIQQKAVGSSAQAELDLLHVAIVICNCGYLKLALRQYEEARSMLEEALLIQQSVLDDNHRAVRDTLSNIEFANAFHS